jgi:hypothetical protein
MDKVVEITIRRPTKIPFPYPMAGKVFEDFVVQGFTDGKKSFGGVTHSARGAASWLIDFLS